MHIFSSSFSKSPGFNPILSCLHSYVFAFKLQNVYFHLTFALKLGTCSIVFLKIQSFISQVL